jgi:hypothetical protein
MKRFLKKPKNGPSWDRPVVLDRPCVRRRAAPRTRQAYINDQTVVWVVSGPVCTGTAEAASGTMSAGFSFCL